MTLPVNALQGSQWHAPKDPKKTPWFGPGGWLSLISHLAGTNRRRVLAEATVIQNAVLNQPALTALPGKDEIEGLRRLLRRHGGAGVATRACIHDCLILLCRISLFVMGMRPSQPQIASALAMFDGRLIQLAPGEGKTLAVSITAIMFAWRARPCHVVTANEYLAARDAQLMNPLFAACGVSVAAITHDTPAHEMATLYRSDVVYATANQFLADFLRDDLLLSGANDHVRRRLWKLRPESSERQPVMRGLHAVIIDEADGVLIDEATTPLIISHPEEDGSDMLTAIRSTYLLVDQLATPAHYSLHVQGGSSIQFTQEGQERIAKLAGNFTSYWQRPNRIEDLFKLAIMAREVFTRDRHYIVKDDKVIIVDENTGRIMPGRSWSHGIHQSIEARVGVELTPPSKTVARMTFQEFFRHYHLLCGASGTLHGLDFELWKTFGVLTIRIPPRTPSRLLVKNRMAFRTRKEKLKGLIRRINELHERGLPILVGTRRILDSEEIAEQLRAQGLDCTVLNAKEHEYEAEIISKAGGRGCITVATNMAGRGTDIALGPGIEEMGGLQVLMFESHESPRVDWQLFGRAGRQGAQGSAQAFASFEEELIDRFLPSWARPLEWLAKTRVQTDLMLAVLLGLSQRKAQKVAAKQRSQLAQVQTLLRQHLSFVRGH